MTGLVLLTLLSSCSSSKKFVYVNDMQDGVKYPFDYRHEAVIQCNDKLSITVSSKQPELAIPFNIQSGSFSVGSDGTVSRESAGTEKGYLVDGYGNIDFPTLGLLHVAGLTVSQAVDMIKARIIEGDYIKAPLVNIDFLNFKYTVLGAIAEKGTFTVDDGRITLLEAIANAGDLAQKARLNRVAVIREVDGNKVIYHQDIRSKDIFNSPCFFLQQNDIIYVEPKYGKQDRESRGIQYTTLLATIVTAVCSVFWATRK